MISINDLIDKSSLIILGIVGVYYIVFSVYDSLVKLDFEKIIMLDSQKFKANVFYLVGQTLFFSIIIIPLVVSEFDKVEKYKDYTFYVSSLIVIFIFLYSSLILSIERVLTLRISFFVIKENMRLRIIKKLDDNNLLCRNDKRNLVIIDNLHGLEISEDFDRKSLLYKFYKDKSLVALSIIVLTTLFILFFVLNIDTTDPVIKVFVGLIFLLWFVAILTIILNHIVYRKFKKKFDKKLYNKLNSERE